MPTAAPSSSVSDIRTSFTPEGQELSASNLVLVVVVFSFRFFVELRGVASLKAGDSRGEGSKLNFQPSRKHLCDVKRNRLQGHGGLDSSFRVRLWVKAGSLKMLHYGASIFDLKKLDVLQAQRKRKLY